MKLTFNSGPHKRVKGIFSRSSVFRTLLLRAISQVFAVFSLRDISFIQSSSGHSFFTCSFIRRKLNYFSAAIMASVIRAVEESHSLSLPVVRSSSSCRKFSLYLQLSHRLLLS